MSKESERAKRTRSAERVNAAISLASYPLAGAIGILTTDVHMRSDIVRKFYKEGILGADKSIIKEFTTVDEERTQKYQKEVYETLNEKLKEAKNAGKTVEESISATARQFMHRYETAHGIEGGVSPVVGEVLGDAYEEGKTLANRLSKLNNTAYRKELREFFKDINITNPIDYWQAIGRNHKVEAAVTGFTFAAITVGALLMISDNRGAVEKLFYRDKKEPDPSIGR